MLEPGTEAPRFALPNQDDETVSLPEEGIAVVYFYPRADTPGCTTEACGFRDAWDEYEDRGVHVFGISDDPVPALRTFADEYDLPVELLSDTDGEVSRAYDSYGEKNVFGNTVEGVFRNTYVVRDGEVVLAYEGVDPEDHAEQLLADIDAL
ncbi:peroxiredoxin [Halosegnis marinus]|uniref:thioredoxin-dependent peroxiredoxin n=1 Tax=Halosegnis marinus TaxID=3034023 RepID=A0ABD5ZNT5_9EURY|nr:peroxiredoxin [Halosegnis sp. DT85]